MQELEKVNISEININNRQKISILEHHVLATKETGQLLN